ncbi:MAG: hypothetical protein R6V77_06000 [Candidatus Cloacimonadaceae bacterium]
MSGFKIGLMSALVIIALIFILISCNNNPMASYPNVTREEKIPADIVKRTPQTDHHPPIMHSTEFNNPIPLSLVVNTAGAEDSPFITPDGNTLYFFFTPDVRIPPNQQLFDDVSGVWVTTKTGDVWSVPQRVWLQKPGKLALDGAVCVQNDEMWFCSAREGYTGVNMFTADRINGLWKNWKYAGDRLMNEIQIGEVHIYNNDLYFHSCRVGGLGSNDIWLTTRTGNLWSDPVNLQSVNSATDDILPFVSSDGNELWFTRTYQGSPAVYRSKKMNNTWSNPELIVSQFAGEPTLDNAGNLYFVHHFYEYGVMIEADIYVARANSNKFSR